jgi:REP element-mobilizing transposase RayT
MVAESRMGRVPRVEFRGALYHVFSRGVRRERIFLDEDDYHSYVRELRGVGLELGVDVLAYCLMPNHPHLCLQTHGAPLSEFMQRINLRHARRFNRKYGFSGHLHETPYQALLVEADAYLVRLVRYIHQNPIRGGLVRSARDWPYSSHREYLAASSWLAREPVLRRFENLAAFERFVGEETPESDAEMFAAVGPGFRFVGTPEGVLPVVASVQQDATRSADYWTLPGSGRPPPLRSAESEACAWLATHGHTTTLAELQGPGQGEPLRNTRRLLAAHLRSRNHSLREIGHLLRRTMPAISRLVGRHKSAPGQPSKSGPMPI